MNTFLTAFDHVPDLRAENARHELRELLVVAFVSVLCGATSCVEMSAFGRAKAHIFRDFLRLKHEIPSHDTFSPVFRMIDLKALDAAFGQIFADVEALMADGDVVAVDGKSLRGARDHTPHRLQTTLTPAQEAVAVVLRQALLLPLDDLLSVVREFLNPNVSRSGLDRCLRRHGATFGI